MNRPAGYNPMRWICEKSGCYNIVHRPKIEQFAGCFPGRIALTDIDATVEIGGHFLFIEWKGISVSEVPTGQRIYFERLTKLSPRIKTVIVSGYPQHMTCRAIRIVQNGKMGDWQICNLTQLQQRIHAWASAVSALPKRTAA